jgi:XTP/dITP diphosphohydrolase
MRRRRAPSRVSDAGTPAPLVLATRSAGKIRELTALFAAEGIAVESLEALGLIEETAEEGIECFDTFEANAEAKARWFAARLPGRVVFAEDSGLVVDALGGAPGVHSKRWAQVMASGRALEEGNNAALLRALEGVDDRVARYRCAAVCVSGAATWGGEGHVEGRITRTAEGAGGFGYDPYFESIELAKTFGVASAAEKASVSHRARAVRSVLASGGAALRARVQTRS